MLSLLAKIATLPNNTEASQSHYMLRVSNAIKYKQFKFVANENARLNRGRGRRSGGGLGRWPLKYFAIYSALGD